MIATLEAHNRVYVQLAWQLKFRYREVGEAAEGLENWHYRSLGLRLGFGLGPRVRDMVRVRAMCS